MTGTLREDLCYFFLLISRSVRRRMRKCFRKSFRENQNTHFVSSTFFSRRRAVYGIMWKNMVELDSLRRQYTRAQKKNN